MENDIIVCRCEEVRESEIKDAISQGASSVDGVKRVTRAGKGLCQGRTCRILVESILAQETQKPLESLNGPSIRPPARVMKVKALASGEEEEIK